MTCQLSQHILMHVCFINVLTNCSHMFWNLHVHCSWFQDPYSHKCKIGWVCYTNITAVRQEMRDIFSGWNMSQTYFISDIILAVRVCKKAWNSDTDEQYPWTINCFIYYKLNLQRKSMLCTGVSDLHMESH